MAAAHQRWKTLLLGLLAGMIYPLGFAPISWWPASIVSVAIIFHIWSKSGHLIALWAAGLYGLGMYGIGVSWVYVSMVNFGNMTPLMAATAVLLFVLFLSLYFIVPVYVYTLVAPRFTLRHRLTIVLPVLWVIFEWLRGTLFTGFAWLYLGYSGLDTWFSAWAPVAGVSLISLVLAFIAGMVAYLYQFISLTNSQKTEPRLFLSTGLQRRTLFKSGLLLLALLLVSRGLDSIRWVEQSGQALDVTLIQADIKLADKWRPENRENLMQSYLAASRAIENTDLIVWPEGALPMVLNKVPESYIDDLRVLDANLVFGVVEREDSEQGARLFNSMVAIDQAAGAGSLQTYRKRHLVPFGEFFPLQAWLGWLFETLNIPMSDFTSGGDEQGNLSINGLQILPTICYEDAYPEDWRAQISNSHMILNISEDAWFGDSLGPHQRLQMARMRAIEFQRSMIRISNSGLSTVIDEQGKYAAISPQFQPTLFNSKVIPMQGETPYTRLGQWPLWLWIAASLIYGFSAGRNKVSV